MEESVKLKMVFDMYFVWLKVIGESRVLLLWIWFMVCDILDMRLNKWVFWWEEMKVKMINEIYVEVEVKLGL